MNAGLYNSRTLQIYLRLLRHSYPHIDTAQFLKKTGLEPYQVNDPGHWLSQDETDQFYHVLVEETGNPDIAREAGHFAASPDGLGLMENLFLGFLGPAKAYSAAGKIARSLTRSSVYTTKELSPNRVEITVDFLPGIEERPYQCQSRIGYLESVPLHFAGTLPQVEHSECIFEGGHCCRYLVSWRMPKNVWLARTRNFLTFVFLAALVPLLTVSPLWTLQTFLPGCISLLAIMSFLLEKQDKQSLTQSLAQLRDSTERLDEQIKKNYDTAKITSELGRVLNQRNTRKDVLDKVVQTLDSRLEFPRGFILALDENHNRLNYQTSYGFEPSQISLFEKMSFETGNTGAENDNVFVRCVTGQDPIFLPDPQSIKEQMSGRSYFLARRLGFESLICVPIFCEGEAVGILGVESQGSEKPLRQSDLSLLMGIAPIIGVSLRNADFIEARERQFHSILEVLAATIDARDPLTSGHSLRVTEFAIAICQQMNLSNAYTEMIRVAALLHDYGKIAVPDSILKKPGRLTEIEYEEVKKHCRRTREILERIHFEGIFRQVPEVAACHHEKLDGSGYPYGLRGKEIPLGARIIAVADFFEALTSKRHYREPMGISEAIELLEAGSGSHFDPKVVAAFMRCLETISSSEIFSKATSNLFNSA